MGRKRNMDEDTKALYDSLIKLRDMTRNDRLKYSEEILQLLNYKKEKNKDKEKEIKSYQFDAFLVKAIDKRFNKSRDADIALMAFGLLQGYEYDKIVITQRRYKYLEESDYLIHNPRSRIKVFADANKEERKGLAENLRNGREDTCIIWLAKFLLEQGSMGKFVEEIDDYIEPIEGKQFARLPELNYRRDAYTAQDSTKNTDMIDKPENNEITQKIPDAKDEDSCSANKPINEKAKQEENEQKTKENSAFPPKIELTTSEGKLEDSPMPEQPDINIANAFAQAGSASVSEVSNQITIQIINEPGNPDRPDTPALPKKEDGKSSQTTKECTIWKWWKFIISKKETVVILILLAIISGGVVRYLRYQEGSPSHIETAQNTTIVDNPTPVITDIRILNADITLTPDSPWKKLKVVIYPREANIDDVQYYSGNPHLVAVDKSKEVVKLASEWRKETERSTQVHVQFEEIDEAIPVTVQEKAAVSEVNALDAGIWNSDDSENAESIPEF